MFEEGDWNEDVEQAVVDDNKMAAAAHTDKEDYGEEFQDEFKSVAPGGKWCYMRDFGEYDTERGDNKTYEQFEVFRSNYGIIDTWRLCQHVQRFFNEEVYPTLPLKHRRRWRLSVIKDWLETTSTPQQRKKIVQNYVFKKIDLIFRSQLCEEDPVTKVKRDRPDSDKRAQDWIRAFVALNR